MCETFRISSLNQIVEDKRPNVRINVNRNSRRRWEFHFETSKFKCEKKRNIRKRSSSFLPK